jgi:hypothetical protein
METEGLKCKYEHQQMRRQEETPTAGGQRGCPSAEDCHRLRCPGIRKRRGFRILPILTRRHLILTVVLDVEHRRTPAPG